MNSKGRIVIADDDPPVVITLSNLMERLSYEVFSAHSGEEALEVLRSESVDMLVTDIHMPGMGGIELMRQARSLYPDMQIMVITGYGDIKSAVAAMQYGAFNYLQKPFRSEELEISLRQGMERARLIRGIREKQEELEIQNEQLRKEVEVRKKVEKERDMQRQQLIQADKMISLGILVSGVAHEINNPNNFIMMNTPILRKVWESVAPILEEHYHREGDFDTGGYPWSEMRNNIPFLFSGISEGSERIRHIVQELKEFAREDTENKIEKVDINRVVENAVNLTGNLIRKSTRHFSMELAENLPDLKGSFRKLEQVLINLIRNACQSLKNREKAIRISTDFQADTGEIVLQVADEGIGIPEKDICRITDPFFTTRRNAGGTGMGLSVSANIIQEHGGKLCVKSCAGEGSTIILCLPVKEEITPVRILVADDESIFRKFLLKALRQNAAYSVQEAADGVEACIMLGREHPDLLILDIHMPKMDGVEICRKIRDDENLSAMKVIITTGLADSPGMREIVKMGFHHIYLKNRHIREFLAMVEKVLREKGPAENHPERPQGEDRSHLQSASTT